MPTRIVSLPAQEGAKPYPAVVYFPSSAAIRNLAPTNLQVRSIDFGIKSGRAVLYPVIKGTYQRSDSLRTDIQGSSNAGAVLPASELTPPRQGTLHIP